MGTYTKTNKKQTRKERSFKQDQYGETYLNQALVGVIKIPNFKSSVLKCFCCNKNQLVNYGPWRIDVNMLKLNLF